MDEKTLNVLEFPKVLERLAGYASFSASAEMIRALRPLTKLDLVQGLQERTSEARKLLSTNAEVSVGGTTDIRPMVELARRGGVLDPSDLLAIKTSLQVGRELGRMFEKNSSLFPRLAFIAAGFNPPPGIIEAITRCISDRADVLDSASEKLLTIRRELRVAHERLLSKLQRLINDPKNATVLQEALITQRNGRYVVPLRADSKGKLKSIVHDQSASGATLFVEPIGVVELNNAYQEAQLAERDEVRRILAELSSHIGEHHEALTTMLEALAEFDLVLACARYADDTHAVEPLLVAFHKPDEHHHPGSTIKLMKARHPLLDPERVVPIDVEFDEQTFSVVITGPNTGGKTVTLKTVGLLVVMAQCGLHIPAQSGSEISCFARVFADIGDEQSIEQSLSTFSGHITNIIHILKNAERTSLVLLDELGAGTDPQEGSALARAILDHLVQRGITNLVATHYPELKAYAHSKPGVTNASLEFDLKTLKPTYRLTIGLPGRSNALAIASRIGLPKEIIDGARAMVDPDELRAEDLLDEIHRQRDAARKARDRAEGTVGNVERQRIELTRRLEKIEDERRMILEKAREQADAEVEATRQELADVKRQLERARQPLEALKPLQQKVEHLQEQSQAPVERKAVTKPIGKPQPLRPGSRVTVRSLKAEGIITVLGEGEAEVQIGNLRVRAQLEDLETQRVSASASTEGEKGELSKTKFTHSRSETPTPFYPSPGLELDIRGQRAEDALDALERYIENAYLAGMPFVRIIHGKGTGRLRQVVREALKKSPHVQRMENGGENEGGEGVTVAHIHSSG